MVVALANHLGELLFGVVGVGLAAADAVHQGNLLPEQQTVFIGDLVDMFGLLVVGKTHGGCTHFADGLEVRVLVGVGERPALITLLLVAVDTVDGVRQAVEQKAFLLVDGHGAESQRLADFVDDGASAHELHIDRVHVWVGDAVPEVWMAQANRRPERRRRHTFRFQGRDRVLPGVEERGLYRHWQVPATTGLSG